MILLANPTEHSNKHFVKSYLHSDIDNLYAEVNIYTIANDKTNAF
jgi:hypothetical protein